MGAWRWGSVVGNSSSRHQHAHITCGGTTLWKKVVSMVLVLAINNENLECEYTSVQSLLLVRDLEK